MENRFVILSGLGGSLGLCGRGVWREKPVKAYNNIDFLNSSSARTLRMLSEYLEPEARFRKHKIRDTIVFFGSARISPPDRARHDHDRLREKLTAEGADRGLEPALNRARRDVEMSRYYEDAAVLAGKLAAWSREFSRQRGRSGRRFMICSGGGPGIMEAANKGAAEAGEKSIGLNISLPFEQAPNRYCSPELTFEFHYFFVRKFWFVYLAKALIIFPGGFGTIDEMMELLTLIQTSKTRKRMPVVVYGKDFWNQVMNFEALAEWGMISPEDLELFHFSDSPEDAFGYLRNALENLY